MKGIELVEGTVYFLKSVLGNEYIFKFSKLRKGIKDNYIVSKSYIRTNSLREVLTEETSLIYEIDIAEIREATISEIFWLEMCIEKGSFIPASELGKNCKQNEYYEIF